MQVVAALFVDPNGIYQNASRVDIWDENRDARKYKGPYPVVAHPPCQKWGKFAKINYMRWGGEHNRPGNDRGCFKSALKSVEEFGGVLEHPAQSYAWKHFGLMKPTGFRWTKSSDAGWVCEVWQSAYGHRANKATWLYYVGDKKPPDMNWERPVGKCQIGFHDQRGRCRNKQTLSKKEANATPKLFRDALLRLARNSRTKGSNQ